MQMTGRGLGAKVAKVLPGLSRLSAELFVTELQAMMAVWSQVLVMESTPTLMTLATGIHWHLDLCKG